MANDLNSCSFIGRLGKDPEIRYLSSGAAVASFTIACGQSWVDKSTGEKKEKTEWIRIVAFNRLAEICAEYLSKGSQVYISGKFTTRSWDDQDGNKKYMTEIVANTMQMLGGKKEGGGQQEGARDGSLSEDYAGSDIDDVPF